VTRIALAVVLVLAYDSGNLERSTVGRKPIDMLPRAVDGLCFYEFIQGHPFGVPGSLHAPGMWREFSAQKVFLMSTVSFYRLTHARALKESVLKLPLYSGHSIIQTLKFHNRLRDNFPV